MNTNKFLLTLAIIINISIIHAQDSCWKNINTITTKWNEPNTSNTENWDWTLPGLVHPVYLFDNSNTPTILVELPYFCTKPPGSGGCNNRNTFSYEVLALDGKQDIYPEDGWELVLKDFGTPNGTIAGRATKNPIFVLYNRYTGKMKVYFAVIGKTVANSAYLQTSFTPKQVKRGLFAHANSISKTAVAFDTKALFQSLNDYALQSFDIHYQWLVSEIQLAYDPCTCIKENGISSIDIIPALIETSNITANIEGSVVQDLMSTGFGVEAETNQKTSFFKTTEAAIRGYNDFTSYQRQLNAILDKSNDKYKNKLVKEWFDNYVKNNPQYQGVANLTAKYSLWDALGRTDDAFKKSIGMDKIDAYQTGKNFRFVKSVASYLPYVGSAIGLIDFLINGGKEEAPPQPSPPMVFNVNLKLDGSITTPLYPPAVSFLTPGSGNYTKSSLTPIYNNILGVFNILKAPLVDMAGIKPSLAELPYRSHNNGTLIDDSIKLELGVDNAKFRASCIDMYSKSNLFKQYKLHEDIKYMLNPAANLTMELIDACMILEYTGGDAKLFISNTRFDDSITNKPSLPFYPDFFKPNTSISDRIAQIENTGLDLEYISLNENIIRFRTKYVPLSCLKNQSFLLFGGKAPTVYVKMLVKMRRKDNPNAELITQIVTYDISSGFVFPIEIGTDCKIKLDRVDVYEGGYPPPIKQESDNNDNGYVKATFITFRLYENQTLSLPNCLPFSTILQSENKTYYPGMPSSSINGTLSIPDNTIVTTNTRIKAKQIVLGTNITISSGVQLISEGDIIVPPDCIIDPDAELGAAPYSNMDLWRCDDIDIADLQAKNKEIEANLCTKDSYLARIESKDKTDDFDNPVDASNPSFDFSIFPNPTQNSIDLTLKSTENLSLSISIIDLMGKTVSDGIKLKDAPSQSLIHIDVSTLDNGVYFLSMINQQNERIIRKFVVAR